jgi:hypothetical protein
MTRSAKLEQLWPYGSISPLKNIRARGHIIFLYFPRAARALKIGLIKSAILKVPDAALSC